MPYVDEILQAILPEELLDGSPTGFAITGHLGMRLYPSFGKLVTEIFV